MKKLIIAFDISVLECIGVKIEVNARFFFAFVFVKTIKSFSKSRPWVYFYHIVTTLQIFSLDFLIKYLFVDIKKSVLCHI